MSADLGRPYRVAIWGPGYTGLQVLRELLRRPDTDVVACRGYSEAKAGVDIASLIGEDPIGVPVTTSEEEALAIDADAIVYTGRLIPATTTQDDEIVRLLAAGRNVITSTSYSFPWQRGTTYAARFDEACQRGRSTLLGTGIHPGWLIERVVPTMSALCTSVDRVTLVETVDVSHHSGEAITGMGFGRPPAELGSTTRKQIFSRYYFDSLAYLAHVLAIPVDMITSDIDYLATDKHVHAAGVQASPGTVGAITGTWTAWVDGEAKLVLNERLYIDPTLISDEPIESPDHYDVCIEGLPVSIRSRIDLAVTAHEDVLGHDSHQCGANLATAAHLVMCIPAVVAAPPGVALPALFAHATTDLRRVGGRTSPVAVEERIL